MGQHVSNDDIMDAAVQANAYGFIKSFPKGFDTVVGERGQMLSGWSIPPKSIMWTPALI